MNMRHALTVFIERGVDIMKIQLYARHEEAYVADANVTRTNPFGARKTEKHAWTCMDLHGPTIRYSKTHNWCDSLLSQKLFENSKCMLDTRRHIQYEADATIHANKPIWHKEDMHGPTNPVFKNTQLVRLPPITEII